MSALPLTHHEILELVEPFTRRGRHVDLGATDRIARRLLFRPVQHAAREPLGIALGETLQLESLATGSLRLTRRLTLPGGPHATLTATGMQPAGLIAAIDAVDPQSQFSVASDYVIARSYTLHWVDAADERDAGAAAARMTLADAVVQLAGAKLELQLSGVRGVAAELMLSAAPGMRLEVPEDLLAVLGWDWARLVRTPTGWKSRLRLRGRDAARSRRAQAALERAALHLAQALAGSPAQFHPRFLAARWGVYFRRAIPVLTFLALILIVVAIPRSTVESSPRAWILLFHVPTALIALSFCLQELPQYEIPPWPRRSNRTSWLVAAPRPGGSAAVPLPI